MNVNPGDLAAVVKGREAKLESVQASGNGFPTCRCTVLKLPRRRPPLTLHPPRQTVAKPHPATGRPFLR